MTRKQGCALGCLALGVVAVGMAAFAAVIGFGVFGLLRSSEVTQEAVRRAQGHRAVVEALGEPVEMGWWVGGSIRIAGPSGTASLSIPLRGPRGRGTLYVEAVKQAGLWKFQQLELAPESGARIDLIRPEPVWPEALDPTRIPTAEEEAARQQVEQIRRDLERLKEEAAQAAKKAAEEAERRRKAPR